MELTKIKDVFGESPSTEIRHRTWDQWGSWKGGGERKGGVGIRWVLRLGNVEWVIGVKVYIIFLFSIKRGEIHYFIYPIFFILYFYVLFLWQCFPSKLYQRIHSLSFLL